MTKSILSSDVFQWQEYQIELNINQIFTSTSNANAYLNSGNFIIPFTTYSTANFQTCSTPKTSYITLNSIFNKVQYYQPQTLEDGQYSIYFELFFFGTWTGEQITYNFEQYNEVIQYTSPTTYLQNFGFCDNVYFEIKSVQFLLTLNQPITGQHLFTKSGTNTGEVSIRNFLISKLQRTCYPSCKQCSGPNKNECITCYYGIPIQGECPQCPSFSPYYEKYNGCKDICNYQNSRYFQGFCQEYPQYIFYKSNDLTNQFLIIYDTENIDTSAKIFEFDTYQIYGIFKFKSGISKSIQITQNQYSLPIQIIITLVLFNPLPINCGINFLINNTFYGSIYNDNNNQLQYYKVIQYSEETLSSYQTFSQCSKHELYIFADIPLFDFTLAIVGNYSNPNAGFGLNSITITSGYCPQNCELCEVSFKCKKCQTGYYFYKNGTCISQCSQPTQQLISDYCYDFDDETKYSKYLIQEFKDLTIDPYQYLNYQLISQQGTNFLKGVNDYFSVYKSIRIFGGKYSWAQAKFKRVFQIPDPHHSVTIVFNITFGSNFPESGSFIYTIENTQVTVKKIPYTYGESLLLKIYEKISHSAQTLTIQWACQGNSEPVYSSCGFYQFYIVVHYCQPYCSQCNNQFTCQSFNGTYDSNIIKFSQSQCQQNECFQQDIYQCKSCPQSCQTCLSNVDCLTCKSSYTLQKLGCFCKQNQYEANDQCNDCPYECNQCLSPNNCIECLNSNYRKLRNGKCICMDGYYEVTNDPICKLCNLPCKTCFGPTYKDCLTCADIVYIQQIGNTCKCQSNTYYDKNLFTCTQCSTTCETCFSNTEYSCLSCSAASNRILIDLECKCKVGYYEDSNNICISCPIIEDSTLNECYKTCIGLIWHTQLCIICDSGFELNENECIPKCCDLQIVGYEQCDDGNNLLNDGCYNCQFQCPEHCLTCDNNTILPCPDICGDGFITGIEECDDGNIIPYDGCYDCKFQCPLFCQECFQGVCSICDQDYFLNQSICEYQPQNISINTESFYWKNFCGNGQINQGEACDDENDYPFDGCYNCQLEDSWICKDYGNCIFSDPPKIKLIYLNQKHQLQFVQFEFDQKIEINSNLSLQDIIEFKLDGFDSTEYTINIIDSFEDKLIIKIETLIEVNIKPKLMVQILGDITNKFNQPLESNISQIFLQIPSFITESMREEAKQFKKTNYIMIIIVIVLASLSLILGDFDIFFESYSVLQFQSFLRYINLRYPENLLIYFESSDQLTVQPLLILLKFDQLLEGITLKGPILESTGKFKEYEQDADLFNNLQIQFIQVSLILLMFVTKKLTQYMNDKFIGSDLHLNLLVWTFSKLGSNFAFKIQKVFSFFSKFIIFIEKKLNLNHLISILLINAWDLLLKSFLFLESNKYQSSVRSLIQFILSLLIIGIYVQTIVSSLFFKSISIKKNKKAIFYEGLELLRILLFQYILVFFQKAQVIQILLITIVNFTQICILIKMRRILAITEFISKISVDLSVAFATISSIFYIDNFFYLITNYQKAYIAQAQIYMLVMGIAIVTLKLTFTKIIIIIDYLKKKYFQQSNNSEFSKNISADPKLFLE